MSRKEYKIMCKIRAMRIAKILTFTLVNLSLILCYICDTGPIVPVFTTNLIWFFGPDVFIYLLECKYNLGHDFISYK